jgi:hypothetical protein
MVVIALVITTNSRSLKDTSGSNRPPAAGSWYLDGRRDRGDDGFNPICRKVGLQNDDKRIDSANGR